MMARSCDGTDGFQVGCTWREGCLNALERGEGQVCAVLCSSVIYICSSGVTTYHYLSM